MLEFQAQMQDGSGRLSLHIVVRREKGEGKRYGPGGMRYAYYSLALHKMNRTDLV
jgi:hypothetical protein